MITYLAVAVMFESFYDSEIAITVSWVVKLHNAISKKAIFNTYLYSIVLHFRLDSFITMFSPNPDFQDFNKF